MITSNQTARALGIVFAFMASDAQAVPVFARQTNMACSQCHTVFPELTPFGRQFKAGGYTLSMGKAIREGGTEDSRASLDLPSYTPLGVMTIVGSTHTAKAQTSAEAPAVKNDDFLFPQEFALFFGGRLAPKLGAFVQLTYGGTADHLGFDNTDIRFAQHIAIGSKNLIIGATLNNRPTVSDLWNSTPAWGAPFIGSGSAPTPGAATLIEGDTLAQTVLGLGLYAFWDGLVYAEFDLYRSATLGVSLPHSSAGGATNIIDAVMPYWRLAMEKGFGNHNVSVGTFGLSGILLPGGSSVDNTTTPATTIQHELVRPGDRYTDVAFDAQYQYIGPTHIFSAAATYIYEVQTLDATHNWVDSLGNSLGSDNLNNELHSFKLTGGYLYDRMVGTRVVLATMRGSSDETLYGGQGPRATTLTGEVFYMPWQNIRFGLQYVAYTEFNGAAESYDGAGRNATDNNTLYAYGWFVF